MKPTRFSFVPACGVMLAIAALVACDRRSEPNPFSDAIRTRVANTQEQRSADRSRVAAFYEARAYAPAWFDSKGRDTHASDALQIVRLADDHGLTRATYHEQALTERVAALAAAKGDDSARPAGGRGPRYRVDEGGSAVGRPRRDRAVRARRSWMVAGTRDASRLMSPRRCRRRSTDEPVAFLDRVRPVHPEYQALQKRWRRCAVKRRRDGRPCRERTVRAGQSSKAIVALRQRLAVAGYLPEAKANGSPQFDADVVCGPEAVPGASCARAEQVRSMPRRLRR